MKRLLSLIAVALISTTGFSRSITVDPDAPTTLEINGPIGFQMTIPLVDQIVSQAKDDVEITLIINSPGGEVNAGMYLLNAMKLSQARGVNFRCITTGLAASMALQIFSQCDTRYALPNSFMLYHPVRVSIGGGLFSPGVALTPNLAKQIADDLIRIEKILVKDLRDSMKVSDEKFNFNYHNETLLLAREINTDSPGWLTLVDNIAGLRTITFGQSNKADVQNTKAIRYMHICRACR
jgi:ATP-dependent protease ClpP protease subunit